ITHRDLVLDISQLVFVVGIRVEPLIGLVILIGVEFLQLVRTRLLRDLDESELVGDRARRGRLARVLFFHADHFAMTPKESGAVRSALSKDSPIKGDFTRTGKKFMKKNRHLLMALLYLDFEH